MKNGCLKIFNLDIVRMIRQLLRLLTIIAITLPALHCEKLKETLGLKDGSADHAVHWGYTGDEGPEHWADLSVKNELCKTGKQQSPVDISPAAKPGLFKTKVKVKYKKSALAVQNNGHTIQVNYSPGSYLELGKKRYELLQFHFHSPSEGSIKKKFSPLVAHLVHKNDKGELAVIALHFKKGKSSKAIKKIFNNLPTKEGLAETRQSINLAKILPKKKTFYHYMGSLTTPPCSEGVHWLVLKKKAKVSKKHVEAFRQVFKKSTRPIQPLNGREFTTGHMVAK